MTAQWNRFEAAIGDLQAANIRNRAAAAWLRAALDFLRGAGALSLIDSARQSALSALSSRYETSLATVETLSAAAAAVRSGSAAVVPGDDSGGDFQIRALVGGGVDLLRAATMRDPGLGYFAPLLPIVLKSGAALLGGALVWAGLSTVSGAIIEAKKIDSEMQAARLDVEKIIASNPAILADWTRYKTAIQADSGGSMIGKIGGGALALGAAALVAFFLIKKGGARE